jgi:wobble nucleotide-excising tRNase
VGPKYEYQVNINGHSISLVNTDPNAPQLKNTLSDGDKTTLALAFFIAKIMTTKQ